MSGHRSKKAFAFLKVAPLPRRQVAQHYAPHAYALQTDDFQADLFAHAPNLALLAFLQDETQLIVVLPAYLRALQRFAIQRQTVIEHRQTIAGDLSRSEGRRLGKECVSTYRSRWCQLH